MKIRYLLLALLLSERASGTLPGRTHEERGNPFDNRRLRRGCIKRPLTSALETREFLLCFLKISSPMGFCGLCQENTERKCRVLSEGRSGDSRRPPADLLRISRSIKVLPFQIAVIVYCRRVALVPTCTV